VAELYADGLASVAELIAASCAKQWFL